MIFFQPFLNPLLSKKNLTETKDIIIRFSPHSRYSGYQNTENICLRNPGYKLPRTLLTQQVISYASRGDFDRQRISPSLHIAICRYWPRNSPSVTTEHGLRCKIFGQSQGVQ